MSIKVPLTSHPLQVYTWSWNEKLRKKITIQPGDRLVISPNCAFERMCYHAIAINDNQPEIFCSVDIVRILNEFGCQIPQHFIS